MGHESSANVSPEELFSIGKSALQDFVGLTLIAPVGQLKPLTPSVSNYSSQVTVNGEWNGAIEVSCDKAFSVMLAARIFRKPESLVDLYDVGDALGEITNIIAGNVKALLPGPARMSMPVFHQSTKSISSAAVCACLTEPSGKKFWISLHYA